MEKHLWSTWIILQIVSDFIPIFPSELATNEFLIPNLWWPTQPPLTSTTKIVDSTKPNDSRNSSIDIEKLVCVDDYEKAALKVLNKNARTFYTEGTDEEITLRESKLGYKRITLKPRALVDVSQRKLTTKIFGKEISFPFGISPTAFQKLATPEGEAANARAAAAMGVIYTLPTLSTTSIEDVAKAAPYGRKWMHLYIFKNRTLTADIMQRAEANGFEAFAVTIDSPAFGPLRKNLREPFFLPEGYKVANFGSEMQNDFDEEHGGLDTLDQLVDPSITWKDIQWVQRKTHLPVIVKGLLSAKDAEIAISYRVDGILVSNQGGRQLETDLASIDVLPEIVQVVNGRVPVFVDGGVRMGTDIFKALALGADMVLAGSPLLWGLAVNGEQGAKKVIQILKDEFNNTMALSGIQNVAQITKDYVGRSVSPLPGQGIPESPYKNSKSAVIIVSEDEIDVNSLRGENATQRSLFRQFWGNSNKIKPTKVAGLDRIALAKFCA